MRNNSAHYRHGIRRGRRSRQMCEQPHDQRRLARHIYCKAALSAARFPSRSRRLIIFRNDNISYNGSYSGLNRCP